MPTITAPAAAPNPYSTSTTPATTTRAQAATVTQDPTVGQAVTNTNGTGNLSGDSVYVAGTQGLNGLLTVPAGTFEGAQVYVRVDQQVLRTQNIVDDSVTFNSPTGNAGTVQYRSGNAFGGTDSILVDTDTGAVISVAATGNIAGAYFIGNGSLLTGIAANTTYNDANVITLLGNLAANIVPSANAVYNLGNAARQWGELWVSGNTIYIGGVPLSIAAGNVLTVNGETVLSNDSNTTIITTGNITAGIMSADYVQFLDSGSVTESYISETGFIVGSNNSATLATLQAEDVRIITDFNGGSTTWTFGANGDLEAPGSINATGNVVANSTVQGNVITADSAINTAGIIGATGNITGGNIISDGEVISTGRAYVQYLDIRGGEASGTIGSLGYSGNIPQLYGTAGIQIVTGDGEGGPTWQFDTAGNLTAPGNITATGNITGNFILADLQVIATGDVTGSNIVGINSVQTANVYATDSVSATGNVIGGNLITTGSVSATGNITATGNVSADRVLTNSLLSDTDVFVQALDGLVDIRANGNVVIKSADANYEWLFDDAGVLTTPGDIDIGGGLELSAGIVTTATNSSLQAANGGLLSLSSTDSNTTSESAVRVYVDTADNANNRVYIYTDNQGTGDLGTWTFAPDGTLSLPGETAFIGASANFVGIYPDASQNNGIEVYTTATEIFNTGNVNITANVAGAGKTWTFDNTGVLTAPGNVVAGNVVTAGNVNANYINATQDIAANYVTVTANVATGNLIAVETVYALGLEAPGTSNIANITFTTDDIRPWDNTTGNGQALAIYGGAGNTSAVGGNLILQGGGIVNDTLGTAGHAILRGGLVTGGTPGNVIVGDSNTTAILLERVARLAVYADTAARDAAVPSPEPGMVVYVTGTGMQVRGATQWNTVTGTGT